MKRYLLFFVVVTLGAASLQAQDIVIKASKKVSPQATPRQIIDSLKKRFPNARAVQAYKTSVAAKNGWNVDAQNNMDYGEEVDMYTLSFKRADFTYYALFKPDGTLVKSKFQQNGVTLPETAKASLKELGGNDYKNYKLVSDTYYKTVDYGNKKNYYQVVAVSKSNASIKKTIILDDDGKVVKVQ